MKDFDITLYGILDPEHCLERDLGDLAEMAANNGATILQYRDKVNETRHMVAAVTSIIDAVSHTGVKVIVNDRVDVAMAAGADGVHLGPADMDAGRARRIMGNDMIIGISVKTVEGAENVPAEFVDYAFIGGVYPTTSKDNRTAMGVEGWIERAEKARQAAPGIPIGAIAGITAETAPELIRAGADGIAVISEIFKADNVPEATRKLREAIEESRGN